ncbi:MAG: hypothetical protein AAGA81_08775 [Acidobacteriota bacterium]
MTIRTMLTIVRGFGVVALVITLSAGIGALTSELTGDSDGIEGGLRLHIVLGLSAGLFTLAAHAFFVFFLPRAALGLRSQGVEVPGWGRTVLVSMAAAAATILAVVFGVESMTESFRDDLHRLLSLAAVVLQMAALGAQTRASAVLASAEAEDLKG